MIRATGLVKRFGRARALDGLDLHVPAGAIYGLIGENGAGKTSTLRILATLSLPDAGTAEVAGADVLSRPDDVRRRVGYMPDFFGIYDDLKVGEYLDFYASLYGVRGPAAARLRDDLLELVDLGSKREDYVEHLSRGMQQRLCLARALVHDPQVLLLDEPASGLDPVARVELRELLKELGRMGKTVVISSHILSELADLCSHVGFVAGGRVLREGRVEEVLRGVRLPSPDGPDGPGGLQEGPAEALSRPWYVLRVLRDAERAGAALERVPAVTRVATGPEEVRFECDGGAEGAAAALAAVVAEGVPVVRFAEAEQPRHGSDLESVFLQLARGRREPGPGPRPHEVGEVVA
jgi:ABC-2 type transport system ATP-binding protein